MSEGIPEVEDLFGDGVLVRDRPAPMEWPGGMGK
jgi:hypothetical protein